MSNDVEITITLIDATTNVMQQCHIRRMQLQIFKVRKDKAGKKLTKMILALEEELLEHHRQEMLNYIAGKPTITGHSKVAQALGRLTSLEAAITTTAK